MTGLQTLLARAALGAAAAVAGTIAVAIPRLRQLTNRNFDRTALALFFLTRIGLFGLIFFVLHLAPRGDIPSYYVPEGLAAIHGQLPYRDFPSSYAPLHSYLDGTLLALHNSPLTLILFTIAAESFLIPLWLRIARGTPNSSGIFSEDHLRTAALLYLFSPISLQYVAIDGQDNVLIAVLLALALLSLARSRAVLSGALVALAAVAVKFLPLVYAPAFFLAARGRDRLRWLAAFAATLLAGYGIFAALGAPVLEPLQNEGTMKSAGNIPYLIESLTGLTLPTRLLDLTALAALTAVLLLAARTLLPQRINTQANTPAARIRTLTWTMASLTFVLLLFPKKTWPAYLMLSLFPICLLVARSTRKFLHAALFSAFSLIAVVEHSYWASLFDQDLAPATHSRLIAGDPLALGMILFQVLLLSGYLWLFTQSIRRLQAEPAPAS